MGQNPSTGRRMQHNTAPFAGRQPPPTANLTQQFQQYQAIQEMNRKMQEQIRLNNRLNLEQFNRR